MRCRMRPGRASRVPLLVVAIALCATGAGGQEAAPAATGGQPANPSVSDRVVKWIQSQRDRIDQLSERRAQNGFFPRLGVVTAGSGLAAGVGLRDGRVDGSPLGLQASAIFSYRRYEEYELLVGLLERQRDTMGLGTADAKAASMFRDPEADDTSISVYGELRYRHFPREPYYGMGPDSLNEKQCCRSDFLLFGGSYDAVVQYRPAPKVGIAGRVGLLDVRVGPGQDGDYPDTSSRFSPEAAPGLSEPLQFLTVGVGVAFDAREPRTNPRSGALLAAAAWRFDARGTSGFDFTRLIVDARGYFTPLEPSGVLALRALLSWDVTAAGAQVPFYLQQALGGGETVRGFPNYRFRDLAVAAFTAEYRRQVYEYVDVGPFVDVGAVGPGLSKLSSRKMVATAGVRAGLRYRSRALFHFDLGVSRDGASMTAGSGVLF